MPCWVMLQEREVKLLILPSIIALSGNSSRPSAESIKYTQTYVSMQPNASPPHPPCICVSGKVHVDLHVLYIIYICRRLRVWARSLSLFIFIGLLAFLWVEASHLKGSLPAGGQQTWRSLSHTHSYESPRARYQKGAKSRRWCMARRKTCSPRCFKVSASRPRASARPLDAQNTHPRTIKKAHWANEYTNIGTAKTRPFNECASFC